LGRFTQGFATADLKDGKALLDELKSYANPARGQAQRKIGQANLEPKRAQ